MLITDQCMFIGHQWVKQANNTIKIFWFTLLSYQVERLVDGMFNKVKIHLNSICRKCITIQLTLLHYKVILYLITNKSEQLTNNCSISYEQLYQWFQFVISTTVIGTMTNNRWEIKLNEVNYEGNHQTDVTRERTDSVWSKFLKAICIWKLLNPNKSLRKGSSRGL